MKRGGPLPSADSSDKGSWKTWSAEGTGATRRSSRVAHKPGRQSRNWGAFDSGGIVIKGT